jgi:glycosyltransferase involved in cell wall biosynthesis
MKVAITSTRDRTGGAARFAFRLHRGLIDLGTSSNMFVREKQSDDEFILSTNTTKIKKIVSMLIPKLDELPLRFYPDKSEFLFSPGLFGSFKPSNYNDKYDIFNIHWTSGGFQSISSIEKINKPIVITLHDSWTFTGGCHIPFDCEKFIDSCGECPQLNSTKKNDLSHLIWSKKNQAWKEKNLVLVGGSKWIADNAQRSSLLKNNRIEVINPGLDLAVFKPLDKKLCRNILGINENDIIILFGAVGATSDKNKGFQLLLPTLLKLQEEHNNSEKLKLFIFGASSSSSQPKFGFDTQYLGELKDDISLSIVYSAADVTIVPSMQESFGQTASESFSCGTPVVAFNTSGLKDIIDHQINGFLAKPFEPDDLARGITWMLSDSKRLSEMGVKAREKAERKFDIRNCADNYINVFNSVLSECKR